MFMMASFSFSIHDQPWTSCIRVKISQVLVQFSDPQTVICIDTDCKNLPLVQERHHDKVP